MVTSYPEEFVLDMSKARRRTGRSRRNIRYYWNSRYRTFLKAGFTEEEATWGANNGLSLRHKDVRLVIRHRKALVELYMSRHYQFSREKAILMASKDLRTKLEDAGETELNLFYEVSP